MTHESPQVRPQLSMDAAQEQLTLRGPVEPSRMLPD